MLMRSSACVWTAAFLLCGCGGSSQVEVAPVSGTVIYQGKPVQEARVTFRTEGSPRAATGITNEDGEYKLTTFRTNDGAVPGEHRVTIVKFEQQESEVSTETFDPANPGDAYNQAMQAAATGKAKTDSQLPSKYADAATTPLTRTVVGGEENVFDFNLDE